MDGRSRILSNRTIAWCATGLVIVATAACWLLLELYGQGTAADKAQLEGVRTVGTIVLGAGGAVALLLAARRQQTAEQDLATKRHDLALREQANADLRHDSAERRITELYLNAVEQLGSDKAPVRLAGLYALDRLAQDNAPHRQTIVNVVSAYLRMPYELPGPPLKPDGEEQHRTEHQLRSQEREVRVTAQRILTDHLTPGAEKNSRFWQNIDLDLSGALLIDFNLHACEINNARFAKASFSGDTFLLGVRFTGDTDFTGANFLGDTWFTGADFTGSTRFDGSTFVGEARFEKATFTGTVVFRESRFDGNVRFDHTTFTGTAVFSRAIFIQRADFSHASFVEDAFLPSVTFTREAYFTGTRFAADSWFNQVLFSTYTTFTGATFTGDVTFTDSTLDGVPYVPESFRPRDLDLLDD